MRCMGMSYYLSQVQCVTPRKGLQGRVPIDLVRCRVCKKCANQLLALLGQLQLLAAAMRVRSDTHQGEGALNPLAGCKPAATPEQAHQPCRGGTWQWLALFIWHGLLQV
jgi:hypothetical protein